MVRSSGLRRSGPVSTASPPREPGERLSAAAELAQHHGVARNTVIKALCRLAEDGLVEIVPTWGTFRARNYGSGSRHQRSARPTMLVVGGGWISGASATPSARLEICNPVTLRLWGLGSQTGSQRRQTPSDTGRRPETIGAARWPVRRRPATLRHSSIAPEKRKVDSSILSLTTTRSSRLTWAYLHVWV